VTPRRRLRVVRKVLAQLPKHPRRGPDLAGIRVFQMLVGIREPARAKSIDDAARHLRGRPHASLTAGDEQHRAVRPLDWNLSRFGSRLVRLEACRIQASQAFTLHPFRCTGVPHERNRDSPKLPRGPGGRLPVESLQAT
jgi:hypothetical protein